MVPQYVPMAPTLVREPFHRPGWVYEEKVDSWQIVAYKDGGRVHLLSRSGVDHTRRLHKLRRDLLGVLHRERRQENHTDTRYYARRRVPRRSAGLAQALLDFAVQAVTG